jgi:hypothetical protein
MIKTLPKDIKLKSGETLLKGTKVTVAPIEGSDHGCLVTMPDATTHRLSYQSVFKAPSTTTLSKWEWEKSACKTPAGKWTEPDGHDPEGFPAWTRIMGFV